MERFSFVFTIFFLLLGPVKLIAPFAATTRGADDRFKKEVALFGALIATATCAFVALAGEKLLVKYEISLEALLIAGGLVLLIAALNAIFQRAPQLDSGTGTKTALQVALSPIVFPTIVPPAGVAAILIFTMAEPRYPGINRVIIICLAIVMVLDFLVMRFINLITKTPGLFLVLQVLGSVLMFMQVALAIDVMLSAFKSLGVMNG